MLVNITGTDIIYKPMSKYYPINLNLKNKKCLVAGAGRVAERKVTRLLECGAHVLVIGLTATPGLKALAKKKKIILKKRHVDTRDLNGATLVILATGDRKINSLISSYCRKKGILVNVVDSPARCNFILPSVISRGDLTISISTAGISPTLSKKIRQGLEKRFGGEYAAFLRIMKRMRLGVIKRIKNPELRKAFFERALKPDIFGLLKRNKTARARQMLESFLKNG